ncbi:hypothetical protein [Streptomyces sp. NPDC051569]
MFLAPLAKAAAVAALALGTPLLAQSAGAAAPVAHKPPVVTVSDVIWQ